jgi:glycosyltransferase involved in cell wall biosynthesis
MLFAPLPPPVGGITSITAMLHRELGENHDVLFVQPVPKTASWKRVLRPLISIVRLVRGTRRVRRAGRVVFFCSSRASFWDKCVWAAIVLLLGRTAVMVMVAGDFPEVFARAPRLARALAHWLFRRRRLIVAAQSASWATVYRGIFPHTTVTQVGATVDPEFFQERDATASHRTPLRLLFVGWIIEDKGILDLLDAVEGIAPSLAGRAHFRLVGPLFGRDSFWQREIDRRKVTALVELAGPVTRRADIRREYLAADAFVFPSHFEGFPVALLEATASGLPSVATDVGGVADMLDGERAGLIVPPRDPGALGTALARLVGDEALRRRLGDHAARHAREAFSREACLASYARVLGIA